MLTDNDKTVLEKNNYMYISFYRPTDPKIVDGKLVCDISHEVKVASYLDCWIGIDDWNFRLAWFKTDEIETTEKVPVRRDSEEGKYLKKYLCNFFYDRHEKYEVDKIFKLDLPACIDDKDINYLHLRINLHNGTVCNWPKGVTVKFGYKSSDRNYFILLDDKNNVVYSSSFHPESRGSDTQYMIGPHSWFQDSGDYLRVGIHEDGRIEHWNEQEMKESLDDWVNELLLGMYIVNLNEKINK